MEVKDGKKILRLVSNNNFFHDLYGEAYSWGLPISEEEPDYVVKDGRTFKRQEERVQGRSVYQEMSEKDFRIEELEKRLEAETSLRIEAEDRADEAAGRVAYLEKKVETIRSSLQSARQQPDEDDYWQERAGYWRDKYSELRTLVDRFRTKIAEEFK